MVRKLKRKTTFISPILKTDKNGELFIIYPESADAQIRKYYSASQNVENGYIAAAEVELEEVIKVLKGHFPSYNLLIDIATRKNEQSKLGKVFNLAEKDAKVILKNAGDNPKLTWNYNSNRDFLSFLFLLGKRVLTSGNIEKARGIFSTLISLDESDPQGVNEYLSNLASGMAPSEPAISHEPIVEEAPIVEASEEVIEMAETASFDGFESHLVEKNLKEGTIKEHLDNISIFSESITCIDATLNTLKTQYESGITKSRFNKLVTTLNQYSRYSVTDKNELKDILSAIKSTKEELIGK